MRLHLRTELILEALSMAADQRYPRAVIHHSNQGPQHTSVVWPSVNAAISC